MSIKEELKLISKTLSSEKFRTLLVTVNEFKPFLHDPKLITFFKWLESRSTVRRSKQDLFLIRRLLEIKKEKVNLLRHDFIKVLSHLRDIFSDIQDIDDISMDFEEDAILVDNFYLLVKELDLIICNSLDLKYDYKATNKLCKFMDFNTVDRRIIIFALNSTVKRLEYLDEVLNSIRLKLAKFTIIFLEK